MASRAGARTKRGGRGKAGKKNAKGSKKGARVEWSRGNPTLPINGPDQNGRTTLMNACIANCMPLVALLLDGKADVDARDKNGMTALMHAAKGGHSGVAQLLLRAHADAGLFDNQERGAFSMSQSIAIKAMIANAANMSKDLQQELDEKRKFTANCIQQGDDHVLAALNSGEEKKILGSIAEAIRFYNIAKHYEPKDDVLQGKLDRAVAFQRRVLTIFVRSEPVGQGMLANGALGNGLQA